jgi:hypothetical protein
VDLGLFPVEYFSGKGAGFTMGVKRKIFLADFKAKVALESIRGIATAAEIALRHK